MKAFLQRFKGVKTGEQVEYPSSEAASLLPMENGRVAELTPSRPIFQ